VVRKVSVVRSDASQRRFLFTKHLSKGSEDGKRGRRGKFKKDPKACKQLATHQGIFLHTKHSQSSPKKKNLEGVQKSRRKKKPGKRKEKIVVKLVKGSTMPSRVQGGGGYKEHAKS